MRQDRWEARPHALRLALEASAASWRRNSSAVVRVALEILRRPLVFKEGKVALRDFTVLATIRDGPRVC
jgi:hypothetical protein